MLLDRDWKWNWNWNQVHRDGATITYAFFSPGFFNNFIGMALKHLYACFAASFIDSIVILHSRLFCLFFD